MASTPAPSPQAPQGRIAALLSGIERAGNALPDPALLFVIGMLATWAASWALAGVDFESIDPRTKAPIEVQNLLAANALLAFLSGMVKTFVNFAPLGVVLVALLGVGVAEHTGLIRAGLRWMLSFTPRVLLTPALILVASLSHTAVDAGYVLVIPLGGVIFHAAGRHPLAGIAAAFAGVSGGFSANPLVSSIDPMLQGFTQGAAQILQSERLVNPLCNYYFTATSTILIVLVGWWITDRVIEPRLRSTALDGEGAQMPQLERLDARESRAWWLAIGSGAALLAALAFAALPPDSPLRGSNGKLTANDAPLMQSIVPLILIVFLVPGVVFGALAGTVKSHRDVIQGMSKSLGGMGYYLVMAFFAALFIDAFTRSNLGALIALEGAEVLRGFGLPGQVTVVGIILLTASVNLLIGSASAKWALLSPIFVPMLMQLGISPELTQAAYRVGDSCTNIVTPLMPYFPLVVVFCTRYVKSTGIGTVISMMLPYSLCFLVLWTLYLLSYWGLGLPLGPGAPQ